MELIIIIIAFLAIFALIRWLRPPKEKTKTGYGLAGDSPIDPYVTDHFAPVMKSPPDIESSDHETSIYTGNMGVNDQPVTYICKEKLIIEAEGMKATDHNVYGKVVISVEPNSYFLFKSEVKWPYENYDDAVLAGIRKAMKNERVANCHGAFILKEISYRDDEYCWDGFYLAARKATIYLLKKPRVV
ncbi:MAG: hypothetical protein HY272_12830 [Gammaproteobacteria bacterium]|nr:hypothetical protein [Gammaproteobacteria bacterium]